ncbi:MAG: hypothetical protein ACOY93_14225 [Bacillota bacterium]
MGFEQVIEAYLAEERERIDAIYRGEELPEAPLVRTQGVERERFRLPEYFRGSPEARIAFIGPHALLVPEEEPPRYPASAEAYCDYYRRVTPNRIPFNHYSAICGGQPWLSLELPPYQAEKELVIATMKGPGGPAIFARSVRLIWALLRESRVERLVLTGADVLRWGLWAALGLPGKPLSATQGHGRAWGEVELPGAGGRKVQLFTSFHWGKEVPMFVRKVPGLGDLSPREAISRARAMLSEVLF